MDRRRAAGALLALAALIACATAAPTASNQTALDLYDSDVSEGCYYNFQHYGEGDRIMTNEPCLNCTCHNRMLMCYLRVCPFTKPIGQNCTNEKRADQCCPIVTCPDVPVDLLTSTSTTSPAEYGATGVGRLDKYGCSINGRYFPEGSKVPPSPDKPCEHCYCIRNMTTCVMQECTLHVDGCTPIYLKDTCCPVRYSCDHAEDELPMLDDMTTTVRPTPGFLLTTTTMPSVTQIPQNCVHDDKIFADGALIKTEKACEHCYCMKGDIVCVVQECGTPMENEGKNCTSLPPREGQCCPDTYICEGDNELQIDEITTNPPRKSIEGSGYRHDDEPYTKQPIEHEGSGFEDSGIEGSGDELIEKPIDTKDSATTLAPVAIGDNDLYATTATSFYSSEKSTAEPDKGYNTVPDSEDVTTQEAITNIDEKTESSTLTPLFTALPDITTTLEPSHVSATTKYESDIQEQKTEQPEVKASSEPDVRTDSTPKYSETQPTIISFDDKESKSTTVQLPDDTHDTQVPEEPFKTTTSSLDDNYTVSSLGTTAQPKTNEQPNVTTEKVEYFETTSINPVDNEIHEDGPPKISPGIIPGEGNCLVDGLTYDNDTVVPSNDKCKTNCKCTSSIVKCDQIMCSGPPDDMVNCKAVYDTLETCCPTYVCDQGKVTLPPQPDSQMSGTEIPMTPDCKDDNCKSHDELPIPPECGLSGCKNEQLPVKPDDTQQPEVCLDGKCTSSSDGCNGDSCQLPTRKNEPCDQEGGCGLPIEQPCIGTNCIAPPKESSQKCDNNKEGCEEGTIPIQTCEGEACEHMSSEQPHDDSNKPKEELCTEGTNCKTEGNINEEPQKECTDDLCTKKQQNELGNKYDTECNDASCLPKEPVHSFDNLNDTETEIPAEPSITVIPEVVTELPGYTESKLPDLTESHTEYSVTESQEKIATDLASEEPPVTTHDFSTPTSVAQETETMTKIPEQPSVTEKQDMITETSEKTGEPQEKTTVAPDTLVEAPVTESQDKTTDVQIPEESLATEKYDYSTEAPAEPGKPHEKATEIHLEVPVTASQETITDAHALEEPSVTEKQDMATDAPAESVKPHEKETEVPKIPVEVPVTVSQEQTTTTYASEVPSATEKQDMTTGVPAEPVESQEKATEVPKTPEEVPVTESKEIISDTHAPEVPSATDKVDIATKEPVESQEKATEVPKTPEEVPVTESKEIIADTHAPEVSSATEKVDIVTDALEEPVEQQEKATEVPEKPEEVPVTESQEIITDAHVPEVPSATEKLDIATNAPAEPVEPKEKATERPEIFVEVPVTESQESITDAHALKEPSATEKPDMVTDAPAEPVEPHEKITNIPEIPVEVPVTESQDRITDAHAPEIPSATDKLDTATEIYGKPVDPQEKSTEVPETFVEVPVTEAQETFTDANSPEISLSTEKEDVATEASVEPVEPQEKATEVPGTPVEIPVTESQDRITDVHTSEEPSATEKQGISTEVPIIPVESQEKATEVPEIPIGVPVTEAQEKITDAHIPEEPSATEKQDIATEAPAGLELVEPHEEATIVPEIHVEVPVTESQEKITDAHAPEVPSATEKQDMATETLAEPVELQEKATEIPESPILGPVTESQEKITDAPEKTSATEKQDMATDATEKSIQPQEKATEIPESPIEGPVTESQERITDAPEEPSATEKHDSATDAPAKPVQPEDEVTESTEIPVEVPVTESQERITDATEKPPSTEKQDMATDVPVKPVQPQEKVPESPEIRVEVPVTESQERITDAHGPKEPSATEKLDMATEAPAEPGKPHEKATEAPEILVEVPVTESQERITDASTLEEPSVTKSQDIATAAPVEPFEPHEKMTEVPEIPVEAPVTESQYKKTDAQALGVSSATEKQDMATEAFEEPVEPQEKSTEVPETPVKMPVTESQEKITDMLSSEEPSATEKQEIATEVPEIPVEPQEKATEVPEIPIEAPVTETQEKITDTHMPEKPSATEKQDIATEAPAGLEIHVEVPVTETQFTNAHTPEVPSATEKQDMATETLAEPVEPQEKVTAAPKAPYEPPVTESQNIPVTEEELPVTTSGDYITKIDDAEQSPVTEYHDEITDVPLGAKQGSTEAPIVETITKEEDIKSGEPQTLPPPIISEEESFTKSPEMPPTGDQVKHTTLSEEPVTVKHITDAHAPEESTATEKQDLTTHAPAESPQEKITEVSETPVEIPVTESQQRTTDARATEESVTEKQDMATEAPVEPVEPHEKVPEIPVEVSVTESQDIIPDAHTPEVPSATEKQDMSTEALAEPVEPLEKETAIPETPEEVPVTESQEIITDAHAPEVPSVTEKQDMSTKALAEPVEPLEKATAVPKTHAEAEGSVTESPEGITDSHAPNASSPTEKQDTATQAPALPIEPQEKPTEVPEIPEEVPATESQEIGTDAHAPEVSSSTEKHDMTTDTPMEPVEPQEKATEVPETPVEMPVTESQDAHTSEEPSATEKQEISTEIPSKPVEPQEKTTGIPEIPVEVPVTESQERITDAHTPDEPLATDKITETQGPNEPPVTVPYPSESPEIPTESPVIDSQVPEEPTKTPVTESVENITEDRTTEVAQKTHEPEGYESPTDAPITESQDLTGAKDQEQTPAPVTDIPHKISESPIASTLEPKLEYSETTPYLVELEEHTHKIEKEGSSTVSDEKITAAPDSQLPEGLVTEETEKPFSEEPELTEKIPTDTEKYATVSSTYKPEESSSSVEPSITDEDMISLSSTTSKTEDVTVPAILDKFTKPESKPTDTLVTELPKTTTSQLNDDLPLPDFEAGSFPPTGSSGYGQEPDYGEEDQAFGPGTCRYGGKVYVSAQQIPRDDPCDFCFCFRSDIICLQQSCPPPIHGCHEEPIQGFCCPRYECPVSMATTLNVTTTTTTTTTTLPPHFLTHAYKGQAQKRGCQIKGQTYKVGEVVRASSGPCLHCTCGGDGQMKCDPKVCTPEPMLRQMIAAAVSSKRRR